MIKQGQKYLVTTDGYFVAPDGEEYRAAWGVCNIVSTEAVFGFTPQRPSTNWFLKIGEGDNETIIAGCQIHYVVRCETRPHLKPGLMNLPATREHNTVLNRIFFTE